jgi:superfamily II DNA/RNA helicase
MTLLGYFNSLRELGGSRRIIEDEVNSRLIKYGERRLRYGEESGPFANRKIDDEPEELTSRVSTNKVANTKRRLALPFTETERVDVALATNMISVGLDIVRLGLIVVLGQPKTAAEYIQTTSRVGRDSNRPGLVVTLLNIHRPRDRSHYERFQSWHASFYRAVEATSVTPFSPRALDRGLAGVTVALARMSIDEMTPPLGASQVEQNRSALEAVVNTITHRAEGHNPDLLADAAETLRQEVRSQVIDLLDTWERISDREKRIQYNKQEVDLAAPLLLDAFDPKADEAPEEQQKFKTQRSLRDVEPTVNVWVRDPAGQAIDGESV